MKTRAQNRRFSAYWFVALAALGAVKVGAASDEPTPDPQDLKRIQEYLSANVHGNGKWRSGPTRVEDKSIATAYPGLRFYYVFSPKYPVAHANDVSLMLRVDRAGTVAPLKTPADYNVGLLNVAKQRDARMAAAAVLSLTFGPFGPTPVAPDDVKVNQNGKGWVCTAGQSKGHKFRVVFDEDGKCVQVEHTYDGPLPICIGGLFQPVTVAGTIAGLGHDLGGALEVVSVEPDSIAAQAGLVPGDILVSFADRPLPTGDIIQAMRQIVVPLKQQGRVKRPIKVLRCTQLIEMSLAW
jgi:membrane-associated protease RseP (regulator of RpoE activity)